jgi:hypothetical protein
MLSERATGPDADPIEDFIAADLPSGGHLVARLLAAAWRQALEAADDEPDAARAALAAVVRRAN